MDLVYDWHIVYVPDAIGFQEQVDIRPMFYRFLGVESGFDRAPLHQPWVWGNLSAEHYRHH